jgi:hypothetical protein
MPTVSSNEKIKPEPLFGINITPSANTADNTFEIAKVSDNLGKNISYKVVLASYRWFKLSSYNCKSGEDLPELSELTYLG